MSITKNMVVYKATETFKYVKNNQISMIVILLILSCIFNINININIGSSNKKENVEKLNKPTSSLISLKNKKDPVFEEYIAKFTSTSKREEVKYKIPSCITLGLGLLLSNAGRKSIAVNNNNHFGIKCFARNCKPGHCSSNHKKFFRKYKSISDSYRANSYFLQRSRYQNLRKISISNYKLYAKELEKAGYFKNSLELINIIELYNLNKK